MAVVHIKPGKMITSKKGIFFSILSIFLLVAIFLVFSFMFESRSLISKQAVEDEKILLANSQFGFLSRTYIPNAARLSSRLALISYINSIDENDGFFIDCFDPGVGDSCADDTQELQDLAEHLINTLVTGNRLGDITGASEGLFAEVNYENYTLINQLNEVRKIYREHFQSQVNFLMPNGAPWPLSNNDAFDITNVDFQNYVQNVLLENIEISQSGTFLLRVSLNISVQFNASYGEILWNYDPLSVLVSIPIYGLIDPVYMHYTKELFGDNYQYNNTFREYSSYIDVEHEDMISMFNQSLYAPASARGPSFLQRLVNSNGSSYEYGVESFVNLFEILPDSGTRDTKIASMAGSPWDQRSSLDYLFFYETPYICEYTSLYPLQQLFFVEEFEDSGSGHSYFTIDLDHVIKYGFNELFFEDTNQLNTYCGDAPYASP